MEEVYRAFKGVCFSSFSMRVVPVIGPMWQLEIWIRTVGRKSSPGGSGTAERSVDKNLQR